ncbi:MAG: tail fiber domain-containing protein [Croceibacterium sp.]
MTDSNKIRVGAKAQYAAPTLTIYGSVRDLTGNNASGSNADGGGMQMNGASDPAFKENVVRVGEHAAGFGLYLFDYKPEFRDAFGHSRQFGVMADEVEQIVPEAVSVDDSGYRFVNYSLLGITRH